MSTQIRPLKGTEFMGPPENQEAYINRPLPLPPTSKPKPKIEVQTRSRSSSRVSARLSVFPTLDTPGNSGEHLAPLAGPPSLRRPRSRSSLSGSPIDRRTSKLQQLTGHKIVVGGDWNPTKGLSPYASPLLLGDDSSSNYSQSLDDPIYEEGSQCPECAVPNLIEDCCDDTCSKRSSDGPLSPPVPRGSGEHYDCSSSSAAPSTVEDTLKKYFNEVDEDEDISDEYHQFTTNIAKVDRQRSRNSSPVPAPSLSLAPPPPTGPLGRSQSLTSRFSISARALFSRKKPQNQKQGCDSDVAPANRHSHGNTPSHSHPHGHALHHNHNHHNHHHHHHHHNHSHNHSHSHGHNHDHDHDHAHAATPTPAPAAAHPPPAQKRPTSVPVTSAPRSNSSRASLSRASISRASLLLRGSGPLATVPLNSKPAPASKPPPTSVPPTSVPSAPRSEKSSIGSSAPQGTPETTVDTPPCSVFECSDDGELEDDEETHMREVIRDFFSPVQRSGDGVRPLDIIPRSAAMDDPSKAKVKGMLGLSKQERPRQNLQS